jgi:hypothetical protein
MRIGINLPGPFYASWHVGGRKRRKGKSSSGSGLAVLFLWPFYLLYGVLWIYYQALRIVYQVLRVLYRWLAAIIRQRFSEWRHGKTMHAATVRDEYRGPEPEPAMAAQTASEEPRVVKPPTFT